MSKTKKPRSPDAGSSWREDERFRLVRRVTVHALVALALGAACFVAYAEMRRYVDERVEPPTEPPAVVFKNRPAWMTDLVAAQLAASFRPAKPKGVFDHEALVQVERRLVASPWVASVRQVRRAYGAKAGDTIEVDCDLRAPMALVRNGAEFWFVDAQGIKLPERFAREDVPRIVYAADGRTNIRVIDGVRNAAPLEAGRRWVGDDLAAGLELVRRLYGQAYADEIVKVNVDNYAGRVEQREAQLVLVTKHNTEVRWGRPWGATDGFIEVRPERKLDNLRKIVAEFGRVDARQQWIDVRFDKITYPVTPATDLAGTHSESGR